MALDDPLVVPLTSRNVVGYEDYCWFHGETAPWVRGEIYLADSEWQVGTFGYCALCLVQGTNQG